jgi:hypothetical protein
MKRSRAVPLLAGLCALLLGLQSSRAADLSCTSLLQGRVLDLRDTRSFEARVAHFRDIICRREYADIADYRRLNDLAGGSLDGALAAFDFRGDGLSLQLAREQICGPHTKPGEKLKPHFVALRSADRGLMLAFRRCVVTSQQVELWVEPDPTDIARWFLSAFNRNPQRERAPRFISLATYPETDLCLVQNGFVSGQVFREDRAICHYSPKGKTMVTINGERPVGSVTIEVPK